jgi:enoyl-CoA hydratase/carnithine racemase
LADAIAAACATDASVLVLEGADGTFCRGMDLETLVADGTAADRAGVDAGVQAFGRVLKGLHAANRPVIAAVDGVVLGGGVGIAAAADLVVATRRSTFALPEALFGLIPAVVFPALLQRMAPQRARLMVLRARTHSAEEACDWGLVDVVVDDEDRESAIRRATRELSRVRPQAVADLKRFSADLAQLNFDAAIARGCAETSFTLGRPDVLAAVRAYVHEGELPWT